MQFLPVAKVGCVSWVQINGLSIGLHCLLELVQLQVGVPCKITHPAVNYPMVLLAHNSQLLYSSGAFPWLRLTIN